MLRKSSTWSLDDPLRVHDMKVPPSVYNRTRQQQKVATLGRVSTANRVLLRRKLAVTSEADETCRLRSLSAEEKRIIEKIYGSGHTGLTGRSGGSQKGRSADNASGLELSRNVRLTFSGNPAVSCGNLALNQARARRAMETAKRPPAAAAAAVNPMNRRPAVAPVASLRRPANDAHSGSRPRSQSTSAGKVAGAGASVSVKSRDAGKELAQHVERRNSDDGLSQSRSQLNDSSSSSRHTAASGSQHPSYFRVTSVVKETRRGCCAETPDKISARTLSTPSCSPTVSAQAQQLAVNRQTDQRLISHEMRGANSQTMDNMTSLSSWVSTGSALLRQISAAREGNSGLATMGDLRPSQLDSPCQEPHQLEQVRVQQLQLQLDDWDPAEVNVSRLIRRRHLEALLSCGGSTEVLDHLLD